MDWLNIIGPILLMAALTFFGWRLERKKVESPAAWGAIVIGALISLLWLKGWGGYALILVALGFHSLANLPRWLVLTVIGCAVGYYLLTLIANSITEVAQEIQKTNARIELLEDSIRNKFYEISRRLPDED